MSGKSDAKQLFDKIPTGCDNAMYVPNSNREFRELVKTANLSGKDVIINVGSGYFRVDETSADDVSLFVDYVTREQCRAREMWVKINAMKRTLNNKLLKMNIKN